MKKSQNKIFSSTEEIADNIVDIIKAQTERNRDRKITVALSGGSTPAKVFRHIALHHLKSLDWLKVLFFWGDERCVPPDNDESNYRMTRLNLLEPMHIPDQNVFRVMGEMEPEKAVMNYEKVLKEHVAENNNLPVFDIIILGLGDDGHTASLFPGDHAALSSMSTCVLATHPVSGQKRVSITMPVINNAAQVVFLVTGAAKAEMVRNVQNPDSHPELPAAHVKPVNGNMLWLLDKDAAKLL
jgi:6-phosphogluconolactonase